MVFASDHRAAGRGSNKSRNANINVMKPVTCTGHDRMHGSWIRIRNRTRRRSRDHHGLNCLRDCRRRNNLLLNRICDLDRRLSWNGRWKDRYLNYRILLDDDGADSTRADSIQIAGFDPYWIIAGRSHNISNDAIPLDGRWSRKSLEEGLSLPVSR